MSANVYFASERVLRPEVSSSLPAKFVRMLKKFNLRKMIGSRRVAVKMHLGGDLVYKTIHPVFVRKLIETIKESGGNPFICDCPCDAAVRGVARGYTQEVLGAPIFPATGVDDKYFYVRKPRKRGRVREIQLAGNIQDSDALIVLTHVKGHGDCGYGGACKNLAMGAVTAKTRTLLHSIEGGLKWHLEKCKFCGLCKKSCPHEGLIFEPGVAVKFNFHLCTFCRHCVYVCPHGAITIEEADFKNFQEGMALATREVLRRFLPDRVLYVNVLLGITMFCDCIGFSSPNVVPDIGIMASTDLVAIESASLDSIKWENFSPDALPKVREIRDKGHLFERIHGKDPWIQVKALRRLGLGQRDYKLVEVR